VQFCDFYAKLIHHFSDLTAPLTEFVRRSWLHKVTMTRAYLEVFDIFKLRLTSAACPIFPEVSSDAMFIVATHASTLRIAPILLQDQGGGLKLVS
jgi:hypothetical protein